jgi:hypothetical protein
LDVFDECEHKKGPVIHLSHNDRNLDPSQLRDGPKSPFSGHELVPIGFTDGGRPHQKGLKEAIFSDRLRQIRQLFGPEFTPGLERIGTDPCDRELSDLGRIRRRPQIIFSQ